MSKKSIALAGAALALVLAACGGDATDAAQAGTPDTLATQTTVDTVATVDVKLGQSELGEVLTGPEGLTLYGFTNDVDATSTCYGTCADAWPPVIVDVDFNAGPGLDFGIFATTVREDGTLQLVAGKWPLYYFAGDAAPGDVTGQGSGGVWFAAGSDGVLIEGTGTAAAEDAPAPTETVETPVATGSIALGDVLTDTTGLTLYGFLNDTDGTPTCDDACADAWPPLLVDGEELPEGLDPEVFSVATRSDGTFQLRAGVWPLYRFAGDAIASDSNGQGSGDVWFAVAADGGLIGAPAAGKTTDGSGSDY